MVTVAELPQVVVAVPFEVFGGKGPTVEVAVHLSQGVGDERAEVFGLSHGRLSELRSV